MRSRLEIAVDELLARVVDDISGGSKDEDVARRAELYILAEVLDDGVVEVDLYIAEDRAVGGPYFADEGDDPGIAPVDHVLDVGRGYVGNVGARRH